MISDTRRAALVLVTSLAVLGACLPGQASAQTSAAQPPRESFGLGGTFRWSPFSKWFPTALRLSAPYGSRGGIDVDIGRNVSFYDWLPDGTISLTAQIRWSRSGRGQNRASRYWLVGAAYVDDAQYELARDGTTLIRDVRSPFFGYGWDRKDGRIRGGLEISGFFVGQVGLVKAFVTWGGR